MKHQKQHFTQKVIFIRHMKEAKIKANPTIETKYNRAILRTHIYVCMCGCAKVTWCWSVKCNQSRPGAFIIVKRRAQERVLTHRAQQASTHTIALPHRDLHRLGRDTTLNIYWSHTNSRIFNDFPWLGCEERG